MENTSSTFLQNRKGSQSLKIIQKELPLYFTLWKECLRYTLEKVSSFCNRPKCHKQKKPMKALNAHIKRRQTSFSHHIYNNISF